MTRLVSSLVLGLFLFGLPAAGQTFSPGPLSQAHAALDGLTGCQKCHRSGGRELRTGCLNCHALIQNDLDRGRGLHSVSKKQTCGSCHQEHKGRSRSLVSWPGGPEAFDHQRTGWALVGSHGRLSCSACHEARRVVAPAVREVVKKTGRRTFLGLDQSCTSCHFDEHRDQLGQDCARCHGFSSTKEARRFDHNRQARFALVSQHRKVDCAGCHGQLVDHKPRANQFPRPLSSSYARYRGLRFASCKNCHTEPHRPTRGPGCTACHSVRGWDRISGKSSAVSFHNDTNFPLVGGHVGVTCASCHGPFADLPPAERGPVYAGTRFGRCDDCHLDAHVGQLYPPEKNDCRVCHSVQGFLPVNFSTEDHTRSRFALLGAHRAVACVDCHLEDSRLADRVPAAEATALARRGRPLQISLARLQLSDVTGACETCHLDVHEGQFDVAEPTVAAKACAACHRSTRFADLRFDHQQSRFPLLGRHEALDCSVCHQPSKPVIYRPLPTDCAGCHVDEHLGQFEGRSACHLCHDEKGFRPANFDHNDPTRSLFSIDGRHGTLDCVRCHLVVDLPPQVSQASQASAQRFAGTPLGCAGCHADQHRGRLARYLPPAARFASGLVAEGSPSHSSPSHSPPRTSPSRTCEQCHHTAAWTPAKFAHERTGFELTGRHDQTDCGSCHGTDYARATPSTCVGCHEDVHAAQFGQRCASCHVTETWQPLFDADAHRLTAFPLIGPHGALPCRECHVTTRDRVYNRAALACADCHFDDYQRARLNTVDHEASNFSTDCQSCHSPLTFDQALFFEHESCFPLRRGSHALLRCVDCHEVTAGLRVTGLCQEQALTCTSCHAHRQERAAELHRGVGGFEWQSRKCLQCHRPSAR